MTVIAPPPARRTPRILGIGAYRPSRVVPNAEIVDAIDSSDEWIQQRSGIKQRRWAAPDETVQMMSVAASREAARARRHRRRRRSTASSSPPSPTCSRPRPSPPRSPTSSAPTRPRPSTSRPPAPASATASRWPPTWCAAAAPSYVLVIGVERLSDITDVDDRGTAFIFADGAGAAVVGPSDDPGHRPGRLGLRRRAVRPDPAARGLARRRRDAEQPGVMPHLTMQGNPVFRWASFDDGQGRPAGARPRRRHRRRPRRASCRTRPTCASSTRWRGR